MVHPVNVADAFDCNLLAGLDEPSYFSLIFQHCRNLWTARSLISKGHLGPYPHGSCVALQK